MVTKFTKRFGESNVLEQFKFIYPLYIGYKMDDMRQTLYLVCFPL